MASVVDEFNSRFSLGQLQTVFEEHIRDNRATGVDMLTTDHVEGRLSDNLSVIHRKVSAGNYSFTRYKLKLVSKGPKKEPREISIPTVRDRICIKALNNFLQDRLKPHVNQKLPQLTVKEVIADISTNAYDTVIRLDVESYYPSIRHEELMSRIRKFIRYPEALALIENAIKTPTTTITNAGSGLVDIGVPQGLAISNVLANLYLRNIDSWGIHHTQFSYFRYVDDILIFCNQYNSHTIARSVTKKLRAIGLKTHPFEVGSKSTIEHISASFDYLGYLFNKDGDIGKVSVRTASIEKLKNSIIGLFTAYSKAGRSSIGLLEWRVNLRVTGCIADTKAVGWLFYFSELNDKQLLFELDSFVEKMKRRFGVNTKYLTFVRAWHEIKARKWESNYFTNFDKMSLADKLKVIMLIKPTISRTEVDSPEKIERLFRRLISREIRDIEVDILSVS